MYLIIGKEGCSKCKIVTNYLSTKGIEYEYKLLDSLEKEKRKEYIQLARENNSMEMPIIIKDSKLIPVEKIFTI